MATRRKAEVPASQLEAFKVAARNLGTDESEQAFDRVLKKIGAVQPAPAKTPPRKTKATKPKAR